MTIYGQCVNLFVMFFARLYFFFYCGKLSSVILNYETVKTGLKGMSNLNTANKNIVKWIMNRNTILEKSYWAKLTPQEQELYKDVREDFLKSKPAGNSGSTSGLLSKIQESAKSLNTVQTLNAAALQKENTAKKTEPDYSILDNLTFPTFIINAEQEFVYVNKAFETAYTLTRRNIIGKKLSGILAIPRMDKAKLFAEEESPIKWGKSINKPVSLFFKNNAPSDYLYIAYKAETASNEKLAVGYIIDTSKFPNALSAVAQRFLDKEQNVPQMDISNQIDGLTGLRNQNALSEIIQKYIESYTRYQHPFSLIMFSISPWQDIVESYGVRERDKLLKQIATLVQILIRKLDYALRISDKEFLLVLPMTKDHQAHILAQRIIQKYLDQIKLPDNTTPSINFGIAEYRTADTEESLLGRARINFNKAEAEGRNSIIY